MGLLLIDYVSALKCWSLNHRRWLCRRRREEEKALYQGYFVWVCVCVCRDVNTHLSTIGGLSLDFSCFYTELMTFYNLLPSFIKYHKCNPLDLAFVFFK